MKNPTNVSSTDAQGLVSPPSDPSAKYSIPGGYSFAEHPIDLNEYLIQNRSATFFMRVHTDSMKGAGIQPGDVVIADSSLEATSGKVVIAELDGTLLIRRLDINNHRKRLLPATESLSPIELFDTSLFYIRGVVTFVIHNIE